MTISQTSVIVQTFYLCTSVDTGRLLGDDCILLRDG